MQCNSDAAGGAMPTISDGYCAFPCLVCVAVVVVVVWVGVYIYVRVWLDESFLTVTMPWRCYPV